MLPYGTSANVHSNPEQCGNKKSPPRPTFTRQTATANSARFSLTVGAKAEEFIRLADWDKMISQPFAKYAISYLLNCRNEKLPKEIVLFFDV